MRVQGYLDIIIPRRASKLEVKKRVLFYQVSLSVHWRGDFEAFLSAPRALFTFAEIYHCGISYNIAVPPVCLPLAQQGTEFDPFGSTNILS
jgi:hypothetical protein